MTPPTIRLFVSDMDSTMIANECIDEMARMLDEKMPVAGAPEHYFHQVQAITKATMDGAALPFHESLTKRIGILAAAGFKETWLPEIYAGVTPMAGAADLLAHLNAHGVHTVLVSGGFTYFAEKVAARLGFSEFHANVLEFTGGTLSGVHGPAANGGTILDGAGKLHIMQKIIKEKNIQSHEVCAIGDGSNDADMVREAGYGIAYRAKNQTLLAAANYRAERLAEVPALLAGAAHTSF
jgi:phosphoserine phosphatase